MSYDIYRWCSNSRFPIRSVFTTRTSSHLTAWLSQFWWWQVGVYSVSQVLSFLTLNKAQQTSSQQFRSFHKAQVSVKLLLLLSALFCPRQPQLLSSLLNGRLQASLNPITLYVFSVPLSLAYFFTLFTLELLRREQCWQTPLSSNLSPSISLYSVLFLCL